MPWLVRAAWYLVLAMMLTAAAWSIAHRLMAWGMRPELAWGISLMFDGSALVCAEYARRAITRGTPAGLPRAAILAFVTASGVITYTHGHAVGGVPAGIAFASTSLLAELLFELNRRDLRDTERHARGLVPEMLPRIPLVAWVMFPAESWRTLRRAVGARLATLDPVSAETPDAPADTPGHANGTVRAAVRAAAATMPEATAEDIAEKLAEVRIDVDADTVRTVLGQQDSRSVEVTDLSEGTISATVRDCVRLGVRDVEDIVRAVHKVHGSEVPRDTVTRTLRRIS
ncbi:DUF2637 domain-containing protein [Yinghuangia soli]|uniref:DUF2637 domain-containing protein n=1 Tax=Yinghuangia soli TaxID=2908204 RepID=A0AA41U3E2_9ACTN|nr:DUF2637 domain-containing protein [Yinghuangia soli]MCF2531735.1 DUF2637 domain-containing protein [Yinghuangia soli]